MKPTEKKSFFARAGEFFPQVKAEVGKVTWPSRKETIMTTVVVFIFAVIAAMYFLAVDQIIYRIVQWILGIKI